MCWTVRVQAWLARLQRDFADLDIPESVQWIINKDAPANFSFVLKPTMGSTPPHSPERERDREIRISSEVAMWHREEIDR